MSAKTRFLLGDTNEIVRDETCRRGNIRDTNSAASTPPHTQHKLTSGRTDIRIGTAIPSLDTQSQSRTTLIHPRLTPGTNTLAASGTANH